MNHRRVLEALTLAAVLSGTCASAQIDLSANWQPLDYQDFIRRHPGPPPVDFTGEPINDEQRTAALSYSASQLSLPEQQCLLYTPVYMLLTPGGWKMSAEFDRVTGHVIAWDISPTTGDVAGLKIWMDGRPQPSKLAVHSFRGFTTGVWEGDVLTTYTTHMKDGYISRNGSPLSDEATMTLHFIRHGNLLTLQGVIEDPIYLTEPYAISRIYIVDHTAPSEVARTARCLPDVDEVRFAKIGKVPHYLPGHNPLVDDLTKSHGIPLKAVMGGAATMYPEYRKQIRDLYVAPKMCTADCCGWDLGSAFVTIKGCPTFNGPFGGPGVLHRPPLAITP